MRGPAALLAMSAAAIAAALLPGTPLHPDLAFVAALAAVAAGVLLARAWLGGRTGRPLRLSRKQIVVDGSNVLYWVDNSPDPATLTLVLTALKAQGYAPVVWFDANAGHLIAGRYLNAGGMARELGLPPSAVHVARSGTPADPMILSMATREGLRIVTNDRYRDWHDAFPQLGWGGLLMPGRIKDGTAVFDPAPTAAAALPRRAGPGGQRWSGPSSAAPPPPLPRPRIDGPAGRRPPRVPPPPAA